MDRVNALSVPTDVVQEQAARHRSIDQLPDDPMRKALLRGNRKPPVTFLVHGPDPDVAPGHGLWDRPFLNALKQVRALLSLGHLGEGSHVGTVSLPAGGGRADRARSLVEVMNSLTAMLQPAVSMT